MLSSTQLGEYMFCDSDLPRYRYGSLTSKEEPSLK